MTDIVRRLVDGEWKTEAADSGGGGSPAGSDGQIQFNDDGEFGASSSLTWDGDSSTLGLASTPNGGGTIQGIGAGVQLALLAGPGDASHVGGEITLAGGNSAGQSGGAISIQAGGDSADGDGGSVTIEAGGSLDGNGGELQVKGGISTNGDGGQVVVSGGAGDGNGGDVIIQGGSSDGSIQLYSGDSNQYVQLDNDGLQIGATKLGFFQGAAVVKPTGVAVTAAAIHAALVDLGLIAP